LRRLRERQKQASADAGALIDRYGSGAYSEARRRGHEARRGVVFDGNRPNGHWDRVRVIIGRKTLRKHVDTATRYLSGS
jgi:hypothetical protein